jgi:hypothetical protein
MLAKIEEEHLFHQNQIIQRQGTVQEMQLKIGSVATTISE